MAYLQSDIDNIVNGIVNRFTGQRIAFPDGRYPGECTAPIVWYLQNMGAPIPSMYGTRADGWGVQFPDELAPYFTHESFQPGKAYPRGTLLMWNSPHIAMVLGDSGGDSTVLCFEQNADPDGAPCGTHIRQLNTATHTCTYALIPIIEVAVLPPIYTQIETYTTPLTIVAKLQPTNKYDIANYRTIADVANHIMIQFKPDDRVEVTSKVHHIDGQDYYMAFQGDPGGYNVNDWDIYVPPAIPYTPPAAPEPIKLATKLTLVATVPVYASVLDAANRNSAKSTGTFPAGEYYLFETSETNMLNIGITNMGTSVWINPKDNVVPEIVIEAPVPTAPHPDPLKASETADWRSTFSWFYPSHRLRIYEANLDGTVEDLSQQANFSMELTKGQRVGVAGAFNYPDPITGLMHYRLKVSSDKDFKYWFAVPVSYNGNAVLKLPKDTWWTRFKKDPEKVLKSIFTESESVWLDIRELKPFNKKRR